MFQDLRFGLRMLLKQPGYTLVAALSLALGIGANTAIFSFVDATLLKPLAYQDPERLVNVWQTSLPSSDRSIPPTATFLEWQTQNQVFSHIAGVTYGRLNLTGRGNASLISGAFVSATYFDLLGVRPMLGRTFLEGEDQPGSGRVAVLTHRFWLRQFGADTEAVGAGLTLNNESYTIIGVLPPLGIFDRDTSDVWLPLVFKPEDIRNNRHFFMVVARVKSDVTLDQANADLKRVSENQDQQGRVYGKGNGAVVKPLRDNLVNADTRKLLLLLLGTVFVVLLIACANVANLMLARGAGRKREIVIRAALGAGRWRLARQLLTESLLLALLSGAMGVFLAVWLLKVLASIWPSYMLPTEADVAIDWRVLLFSLGVSLFTGLLFGLAPAWQATRLDLARPMKEQSAGMSARWSRNKARSVLLVTEVALAFVLVIGATLLIRSFTRLLQVDPGFQPEHLLTLRTNLDRARYPQGHQLLAYRTELLNRMRALPAVQSAAAASEMPFGGSYSFTAITMSASTPDEPPIKEGAALRAVSPDYFSALGVPLLRGRFIAEEDTAQTRPVAMISESLARRYSPDGNALGAQIQFVSDSFPQPVTIIGVVPDVKYQGLEESRSRSSLYLPYSQLSEKAMNNYGRSVYFIARTTGDPGALGSSIQSLASGVDPDQVVYSVRTMRELIWASVSRPRFQTLLFSIFAALALILAAVGLFGVMSYSVAQRTREIGIRMALGAQARDVLKLAMRQCLLLTLAGVAIGLGVSLALTRVMSSLLFGVSPTDLPTFLLVTAILTGVALGACFVPARRATSVDPMIALRYE